MGVISLDQAEPTMVLASPVTDRTGRLLIPAGNVLSDRHIESLRMWGVSTVDVEGANQRVGGADPLDPDLVIEAEEYMLRHLGSNDLTHPFMSVLSRYCVHRKARALQNEKQEGAETREMDGHGQ